MLSFPIDEIVNRLAKRALDAGEVASIPEANALLQSYRLAFVIGEQEARQAQHQAALLTGVNLARRSFLGGVSVQGNLDVPLLVPMPLGKTLNEAVHALQGSPGRAPEGVPIVAIGGGPRQRNEAFQIRTECSGWRGGVLPAHSNLTVEGGPGTPLAAMLAAALAVNEAFMHISDGTPVAGKRPVGLSLWEPTATVDWLDADDNEPEVGYLPNQLWLIGLGHLGQAYLWGLGLLPFSDPSALSLVLQDIDIITPSTESTSILTYSSLVGQQKTRAMAAWAERRGFVTAIHERRFDNTFKRRNDEPSVALCGLDNALGRKALDQVGFDLAVEAGLGHGHQDFRTMRLHTLPAPKKASEIWKSTKPKKINAEQAAYQKLMADGDLDRCGITVLAGKAVGAPFVGAVAATLALAEVLRLLHGGPLHQMIDLDLQSVDHRGVVRHPWDSSSLNPGYTLSGR